MNDFDLYCVRQKPDGKYIITKNGDFFIECSDSKEEAENIANLLNSDGRVKNG